MNVIHELREDQYLVTHCVGPHQTGIRLDHFLKERYHRRSREQLKRAIDSGVVSIRRTQGPHLQVGRPKPSSQLISGDEVKVLSERRPEPEVNFNYQVLFEDDHLLVINKPPHLPVHPAGRYFFNTLLVHLKTRRQLPKSSLNQDYFLVHRIDKETSGVLVLAKTKEVCTQITQQFFERTPKKTYLALVRGICPEMFSSELAMKRSTNSLIELKMQIASVADGGQPAMTWFRRIHVFENYSWIECSPQTGRQHQIRVHLEAAGFPIVGDKLYGIPEQEALQFFEKRHFTPQAQARLILPRHALHAASIRLIHPVLNKEMEFRAPIPQDLVVFIQALNSQPNLVKNLNATSQPIDQQSRGSLHPF